MIVAELMQLLWVGLAWEPFHGSSASLLDQEPRPPGDDAAQAVAERAVFVEVDVPQGPVFVQQAVDVCLRIGVDREFLESRAIQPFRNTLDLPIQIEARWLPQPENTTLLPQGGRAENAARLSLVLNQERADVAVAADRAMDGRNFAVVEIDRRFAVPAAGTIELEAPVVHLLHATIFRQDLLGGRVPVDRHQWSARGPLREIVVVDLPASVPDGFSGAVGRFTLKTQLEPTTVQLGQILKLRLSIEGDGNLTSLTAPYLSSHDSFHVYGCVEVSAVAGRAFVYDFAPLRSSVTESPVLSLCYFDVDDRDYRTLRSAPIPLQVRPGPDELAPRQESAASANPVRGADPPASGQGWPRWQVLLPLLGTCLALVLLWFARRSRSIVPNGHASRSPSDTWKQATAQVHARLAQPDANLVEVLADYLAVVLECPPPAVIGPSLAQRLEEVGLDAVLASSTERLVDSLLAARYGGPATVDRKEVRECVDRISQQRPRSCRPRTGGADAR